MNVVICACATILNRNQYKIQPKITLEFQNILLNLDLLQVHDNDQAILCESGCNFWFHRICTGLTDVAYQMLTSEVYAEWVCDKCLQTKQIPLVKMKPWNQLISHLVFMTLIVFVVDDCNFDVLECVRLWKLTKQYTCKLVWKRTINAKLKSSNHHCLEKSIRSFSYWRNSVQIATLPKIDHALLSTNF